MTLLGAVPEDKLLRAVRLDEVQTALDAEFSFGSKVQLDQVRAMSAAALQVHGATDCVRSSKAACWVRLSLINQPPPAERHLGLFAPPKLNVVASYFSIASPVKLPFLFLRASCRSTQLCMWPASGWSSCWS